MWNGPAAAYLTGTWRCCFSVLLQRRVLCAAWKSLPKRSGGSGPTVEPCHLLTISAYRTFLGSSGNALKVSMGCTIVQPRLMMTAGLEWSCLWHIVPFGSVFGRTMVHEVTGCSAFDSTFGSFLPAEHEDPWRHITVKSWGENRWQLTIVHVLVATHLHPEMNSLFHSHAGLNALELHISASSPTILYPNLSRQKGAWQTQCAGLTPLMVRPQG